MLKAKPIAQSAQEIGVYDALQVQGNVVLCIERGLAFVKPFAHKILSDNGLTNLEPQVRYPYKAFILALQQVQETVGPNTLYLMGRSMPLPQPPAAMQTDHPLAMGLALGQLNESHRSLIYLENTPLTHSPGDRYPDAVGCIRALDVTDGAALLLADLPYPEPFVKGYLEAWLQQSLPTIRLDLIGVDRPSPELPPVVSYSVHW